MQTRIRLLVSRRLGVLLTLGTVWACGAPCAGAQDAPSGAPAEVSARVKYVRAMGKDGRGAIAKIVEFQRDEAVEVRRAAADVIADIGSGDALDPLVYATKDGDAEVQRHAVEGLMNFYMPGFRKTGLRGSFAKLSDKVEGKFTDTNTDVLDPTVTVRPEVVRALGDVVKGSSSNEVRATAARGLGILRARESINDLVEGAKGSKNSAVLYEMLVALQKIRDVSAGPKVVSLLRDPDAKVQTAAIETVGILRHYEAAEELQKLTTEAKTLPARRAAAYALAALPTSEKAALYEQFLGDKDEHFRAAGAEGFARLGNRDMVAKVEPAFGAETKMASRLAMAFALVAMGKTDKAQFSPLQYLTDTLNSSAWGAVAQTYLEEVLPKQPKALEQVNATAASGPKGERLRMIQVLAAAGNRDSIAPLEAMSKDSNAEIARDATRALQVLRARVK